MLKKMAYALFGISALGVAGGYALTDHVLPYAILQPQRRVVSTTPADYGLAYEHVRLPVEDTIELDAFYIPTPGQARANLIMLHGIGSCKEVYLGIVPELSKMGYNVLLWDQRAHGKSGGRYTTYGAKEKLDVSKGVDWLAERAPNVPTGIYGNSMGGAVALQSLAHDRRLRFGLIESTFTNLPEITQAYGKRLSGLPLPRWLTNRVLRRGGEIAGFAPFEIRPVDAAVAITQPVQLIHGDADLNINVSHAHLLFAALGSADKDLHIVPGGDHADLWEVGGNSYKDVYFGFLRRMVSE